MAGEWLKFDANTPEKPEVFAITIALGWDDPDFTVGKLLKIWRWFDKHTIDGNAPHVTFALLDSICGVSGFAKAMADVKWLVDTGLGLSLPNFDKHNGNTAKNRSETAKRVAKHRNKSPEDAASLRNASKRLIPRPIRAIVFSRDSSTCVYCGRKEGDYAPPEMASDAFMCLDHVIPESRNGSDDPSNLVCACAVCNKYKSNRTPDECGLSWPVDENGKKYGGVLSNAKIVTEALPKEEKRREEKREEKEETKPLTASQSVKFLTDLGVDAQVAKDWLSLRVKKRSSSTQTAFDGVVREAKKAGMSLDDVIRKCCERGWAGFEADWVRPQARESPQQSKLGKAGQATAAAAQRWLEAQGECE